LAQVVSRLGGIILTSSVLYAQDGGAFNGARLAQEQR